jgi:NAD+ synthase (glutamine-hydrolysing)
MENTNHGEQAIRNKGESQVYSFARDQKAVIAHTSLNQSALDFAGNRDRIIKSIKKAKASGCTYRTCQETEIPGYGCEDHFMELDTYSHCWEVIGDLLRDPELTRDILVETTTPILFRSSTYNCKVMILNGKIVGIRPKIFMADG